MVETATEKARHSQQLSRASTQGNTSKIAA